MTEAPHTSGVAPPVMTAIVIGVIIFFFLFESQNIAKWLGGAVSNYGAASNPNTTNPSSTATPGNAPSSPMSTSDASRGPNPAMLVPLFTMQDLFQAAGQIANHSVAAATSTTTPTTATTPTVG